MTDDQITKTIGTAPFWVSEFWERTFKDETTYIYYQPVSGVKPVAIEKMKKLEYASKYTLFSIELEEKTRIIRYRGGYMNEADELEVETIFKQEINVEYDLKMVYNMFREFSGTTLTKIFTVKSIPFIRFTSNKIIFYNEDGTERLELSKYGYDDRSLKELRVLQMLGVNINEERLQLGIKRHPDDIMKYFDGC